MIKNILIVTVFISMIASCDKSPNEGYCDIEYTTQKGRLKSLSGDTVAYKNDIIIGEIYFGIKRLVPYEYVPCDSTNYIITGHIQYINVIANYYYPNDTIHDTINDLLKSTIWYPLDNILSGYSRFDTKSIMITDINSTHPPCGGWIDLSFIAPPVLNCSQSYTIYYKEVEKNEVWTYSVPKFYFSQ